MAYKQFGLNFNPFNKENFKCEQRYETHDMKMALGCMDHLKKTRGLGVIASDPGCRNT